MDVNRVDGKAGRCLRERHAAQRASDFGAHNREVPSTTYFLLSSMASSSALMHIFTISGRLL